MHEGLMKRLRAESALPYSAIKDMRAAADAIEELQDTAQAQDKALKWCADQLARRWIPVTERLPDISGRYLTVLEENGIQHMYVAIFQNKFNLPAGKMSHWKVTHWMSLPEPPEEK